MKTGIHIKPCNTGSAEQHNERSKEYLERLDASGKKTYDIYRDETHLNQSWVNPAYRGRSLDQILQNLRQEVKEKTGRAMQEKAPPIREGVCPILPTTRPSDLRPVVDWYAAHGAAVIRIDLHHDEGHTDPLTGERKHNHHAHIIVDYIDHSTGRSVKLSKEDISELQGVVADALHMERGTSKKLTGKEHLEAQEYRERKAGENAARLEARCKELEQQVKQDALIHEGELRAVCKNLHTLADHTVQHFDLVCGYPAADPSEKERQNRDLLDRERQRSIQEMQVHELIQHQLTLRNLMLKVQNAVQRIGKRLQKLASQVPWLKRRFLEREANLEAKMATIKAEAAETLSEAEKRAKWAEKAQNEANAKTARADERVARATEAQNRAENRLTSARNALDKVADILTALDPKSVDTLERMGLRDAVGSQRWDSAKADSQEQSRGRGMHR